MGGRAPKRPLEPSFATDSCPSTCASFLTLTFWVIRIVRSRERRGHYSDSPCRGNCHSTCRRPLPVVPSRAVLVKRARKVPGRQAGRHAMTWATVRGTHSCWRLKLVATILHVPLASDDAQACWRETTCAHTLACSLTMVHGQGEEDELDETDISRGC